MISQIDQTMYRLKNLDSLQQKLSYQSSTGKKLQDGSDDSVLYSRELVVDDKIRTFEGLKTQIERTKIQNDSSDSAMEEIKKIILSVEEQNENLPEGFGDMLFEQLIILKYNRLGK